MCATLERQQLAGWWFGLLALGMMLAAGRGPAAAAQESPRTISTSGEAIVYVVPDEVVVEFGVRTTDANLDRARALNDDRSGNLVRALKGMGIEERHIQTDAMTLGILYDSSRRMNIEGYEATRIYAVTLKDIKQFERLVDVGLKNGANMLQGFTYQTTELRKHRDQARAMAVKAAAEKAAALAGELRCSLGAPRTISESTGYSYYGGSRALSFNAMSQNSVQAVGNIASEDGRTMPLGQIAVRANVSVTFDLVPPK
jgi:uncharacterized protein YggE